jgi:adenylate cyclase
MSPGFSRLMGIDEESMLARL